MNSTIQQSVLKIREEILSLRGTGRGKFKSSADLRGRVIHLFNQSGLGAERYCREIGISKPCLFRWKKQTADSASEIYRGFKRVILKDARVSETSFHATTEVRLVLPSGIQVYGLSKEEVFSWVGGPSC